MTYETILVEKDGPLDRVTLNRPDSLNAINKQMTRELRDYFGRLYDDQSVRVVVLKGAGRAFCAGLDIKEHANPASGDGLMDGAAPGLRGQRDLSEVMMRMRRCPQPILSLVHGPACGGGFSLVLSSDIRIAGRSARMNAAFIRIGLSACDMGVSYLLPRLVGVSVASELMMTGKFIEAERALSVGLVSEVVDDDALEVAARPYIDDMLTTAPLGLRLTKECLNMSVDAGSLEAAIAMEDRNQVLCLQTSDHREGIQAFLEKRDPVYTDS